MKRARLDPPDQPVSTVQLQKLAEEFTKEITAFTPLVLPERKNCEEMQALTQFLAKVLFFTSEKTVSVHTIDDKVLMTLVSNYILVELSGFGFTKARKLNNYG